LQGLKRHFDCVWFSTPVHLIALPVGHPLPRPDPRAMKWQANGELADNDLHVLISHLQQVETEERSSELCRLSPKQPRG